MEIDKIEKVHSIGYRLKDAKVTINQDFKYNVAGMKIEGTQGDTNNMPQWVGKILSERKKHRNTRFSRHDYST
jgi:DNA replication factor GINS